MIYILVIDNQSILPNNKWYGDEIKLYYEIEDWDKEIGRMNSGKGEKSEKA